MSKPIKATELDKTLLGQLIAEIAKFGGIDKSKSSQLAKILLPYVDTYAAQQQTSLLESLIAKKKTYITELAWKHSASEEAVPFEIIQSELNKHRGKHE